MARKARREFLIYTVDGVVRSFGLSLAQALKEAGIDEKATPVVAAIEAHCVPAAALGDKGAMIGAVIIRNPYYEDGRQEE